MRTFGRLLVFRANWYPNRLGLAAASDAPIAPSSTFYVASSRDKGRRIKCYLYQPPDLADPQAVYINFHGSGFVVDLHGADNEICFYLSRALGCVVVDAGYAKAPEHPFPAAHLDTLDIVAHVQARFPAARIALGGFSAGANLALAAAAALPSGTIRTVSAWYPACDFRSVLRDPPNAAKGPGMPLDEGARRVFIASYVPVGTDLTDPRLSPVCADAKRFPPVTFIVGDADPLCAGCVAMQEKLVRAGVDAEILVVPGARHGWERFITGAGATEAYAAARRDAWALTVRRLRAAFEDK